MIQHINKVRRENSVSELKVNQSLMDAVQKCSAMQRRANELSVLFKQLYEGNALGRITNEKFRRLSSDYNI